MRDLQIGSGNGGHDLATLHGKGGRMRQCPLWPETERALAEEISGRAADDAVFVSRLGGPFTRFGVYRLVERCAARVQDLAGRTITPHVIRHTTACHLVLAGVDINTVRAWLGHVSISTTNIYAEIDLTLKANAVALCEVGAATGTPVEGGQGPHGLPEILVSEEGSRRSRPPICHSVLIFPWRAKRTTSCGASWMRSAARTAPTPNARRSSLKSPASGDRASASMPAARRVRSTPRAPCHLRHRRRARCRAGAAGGSRSAARWLAESAAAIGHGGQRTSERQDRLDALTGSDDVARHAETDGIAEKTAHRSSRRVDRRLAEAVRRRARCDARRSMPERSVTAAIIAGQVSVEARRPGDNSSADGTAGSRSVEALMPRSRDRSRRACRAIGWDMAKSRRAASGDPAGTGRGLGVGAVRRAAD